MALSNFVFLERQRGRARTLFLLHGTGGNEADLLPLAEAVTEDYNLVGLRGNVSENGMRRFFARTGPGIFDQTSVEQESDKLAAFLEAWYTEHELNPDQAAFVGYSNGANMLLATLLRHPQWMRRVALLHPMMPFEPENVDLSGYEILVTYGAKDAMVPVAESQRVMRVLEAHGATVTVASHYGGHELGQPELDALAEFL